jgi:hypothetical protein
MTFSGRQRDARRNAGRKTRIPRDAAGPQQRLVIRRALVRSASIGWGFYLDKCEIAIGCCNNAVFPISGHSGVE